MQDESNLLERLRNGDAKAFKSIYDDYFGLVTYVIRRCGIGDGDCYDLVQDTFLALHRKNAQIREQDKIKSWLVTTARNLALDHLRKAAVRKNHLIHACAQDQEVQKHDTLIPASLVRELEVTWVGEIIEQIEREHGDDVFSLFYRDGLSAKEIAARKNISTSSVTNRLSRLRNRFRERIQQHIERLRSGMI